MGVSGSSLLDEAKSEFIRGEADAELSRFAPFFRKQFSVARFNQAQQDLEQRQRSTRLLLKQKAPPEGGEVLYEDAVFYFDETRKWRERYVVVRANYCLELHDGLEGFVKGAPVLHRLLPTGGAVLTTEEKYTQLVEQCFPDKDSSVKEDFAPPLSSMPGQFPVYLRLPYRRDSYFCFKQQQRQENFISALWDCIRHQNQDFLKKTSCEVQAFLKSVQFYRDSQNKHSSWNMLIGSDVRVLSNSVMERLLPTLEKDFLPKLKAKKTEKKRVWFATVEAAYVLVQERLLEKLSGLKDECRTNLRAQEVLIHSDMDLIQRGRDSTREKVQACVSSELELLVSEKVRPLLSPLLEELMEPISLSFTQGRAVCSGLMETVTPEVMEDNQELKKVLLSLSRPRLFQCFEKMAALENQSQIRDKFGFNNVRNIVHSSQIDLQQLVENASFTFESLLTKALQENPDDAANALDKIRPRVLKQFDYDSSSVRKKVFEEALLQITLPFIKEQLNGQREQLRGAADQVLLDHCDFIDIDNAYEDVLLQALQKDVSTVLSEASRLQKYDLLPDSGDLRASLSSTGSAPASPAPGSPALSVVSPAPTQTPQTTVIEAQVETVKPGIIANGNGLTEEVKVSVEPIVDVSEPTGKEITVQTLPNKMEDEVEAPEQSSAPNRGDEKVGGAVEVTPAATETSPNAEEEVERAQQETVPQQEVPKQEVPEQEVPKQEVPKQEVPKQEVPEQEVPKQEAAPATEEEEEPGVLEGKVLIEAETAAREGAGNKMAETETDPAETEVCEVLEKTEKERQGEAQGEAQGETAAPSGGEVEGTAAEERKEEREGEREGEGNGDEGSAPSDVLRENSQSQLSSEDDNNQSEERTRAVQELSEVQTQEQRLLEEREQRGEEPPLERGEGGERGEGDQQEEGGGEAAAERPSEGEERPQVAEAIVEQCPPVAAVAEVERPPVAEERPTEAAAAAVEKEEHPQEAAAVAAEEEEERPPVAAAAVEEEERPLDSVHEIRALVEEVIEVEELLQKYPSGIPTDLNQD